MPARLLNRLPISVKLPIIMGGLIFLVHMAMSTLAFAETRTLVMDASRERLTAVSGQIATMLETQARQLATQADSLGCGATFSLNLPQAGGAS